MLPPPLNHWLKQLQGWAAAQGLRWVWPGEALGPIALGPIALGSIALAGLIGLLWWDGKLLLAIVAGLGAMALVYSLQRWDWPGLWERFQPLLLSAQTAPQRLLLRCVASGSLAMVGTYMGASIWQRSHDGWLLACLLLQGLGLLGLLGWSWFQGTGRLRRHLLAESSQTYAGLGFDEALAALAKAQPLGRLLAVHQLQRLSQQRRLSSEQERTASQALQLLLLQEPQAAVREAALRSLAPRLMAPRREDQMGSLGAEPQRPDA